jgi:predicted transcriptional regulator
MTEQSFKRRARHDIIMEILKSAVNGSKKTTIMYKASLSFEQLEQYLNALEKAGFLTEESGVWKTTEKGHHVIEACRICLRLTGEFAHRHSEAKP